ncbi:MAG: hypothetical protein JJ953_09400 [Gracilimonas sp.]|uniref:hypothetical protein n=1 Tax=Gracilimonas TaxID=649462 RepID=UPI001AFD4C81|nr:hypothetical protein [Gracilimonas sp.]MBO6586306.1 hypothetical protein [Gracilimonas sp.]MBO6614963.1 hypothetical protein [Gracilimonas sp.]
MKRFTFHFLLIVFIPTVVAAQYNPLATSSPTNTNIDKNFIRFSTEEFKPKKEGVAFLLSAAVPTVSFIAGQALLKNDSNMPGAVLAVGGIIIGPSAGNMYAENPKAVGKGIVTRAISGGMITVGAYMGLLNQLGNEPYGGVRKDLDGFSEITAAALFFGGSALLVYSTFYDLFNSMANVRKYNEEKQPVEFTFAPTYFPKEKAPGISVSLSF